MIFMINDEVRYLVANSNYCFRDKLLKVNALHESRLHSPHHLTLAVVILSLSMW